ncbi:MAG: CBS domain-containing protein [Methanomassiliicoccales archaeon]|jgi:CBS domain-containing protein|nr:CBS domain-containing protein [Methanomassiliicoccales archaeon]NYT14502.1 CBS domain-containing protein [Methanomassiliicoccales archaeon]
MARKVKEFMTPKNEIVTPGDSVITAVEVMVENDKGSVVVIDDDKLVGIFTERDLLRHYLMSQSKFLYMSVSEVMSSPPVTVGPEDDLIDAFTIMAQKDIRHLPVVGEDQELVGFLSWKSMFDWCSAKIAFE